MLTEFVDENKDGEEMDWVRVKALRSFNISRRKWSNERNLKITEDEEYVLPRNGEGMKHYFSAAGFLRVIDNDPDIENVENFDCEDCDKDFDSERGLKSHRRQTHEKENDKKEEEE